MCRVPGSKRAAFRERARAVPQAAIHSLLSRSRSLASKAARPPIPLDHNAILPLASVPVTAARRSHVAKSAHAPRAQLWLARCSLSRMQLSAAAATGSGLMSARSARLASAQWRAPLSARGGRRVAIARRLPQAASSADAATSAKLFQELDETIDAFRRAPPSMVRGLARCASAAQPIGWSHH